MAYIRVIQNKENGNVFDCTKRGFLAAYAEANELYDVDDPTNAANNFWDYYEIVVLTLKEVEE